jgi:polysaccharide biosynthesis protein PslG
MPAMPGARWRLRAPWLILVLLAAVAVSLSARAAGASAHSPVTAHTAVVNSFGGEMFGVAAGGTLQNEAPGTLARDIADDRRAGSRWIRFDINWAQIQNGGPDVYDWSHVDRVVHDAEARGMSILGTLVYTPGWARPAGTPATWAPRPATFARFAAAAARHLGAEGVHALEIWNEPNLPQSWAPRPSTGAYTALLRAADVAIRRVAPATTVVTGGLAPAANRDGDIAPVTFLQGIYRHGGRGHFDAVGDHPYCWPVYPGTAAPGSAWYEMYGTRTSLRSVMIAHHDGAEKIWATEFGAPTAGPRGAYVSPATQARMVRDAYTLFAAYRWAGPLFLYQGRDAGSARGDMYDHFGFINHDFAPKPAFRAYQEAAATL